MSENTGMPGGRWSVINGMSELLKRYIASHIPELSGDDRIVFDSPAQLDSVVGERLSLFLYQTEINPYLRNLPPLVVPCGDDSSGLVSMKIMPAPLVLDLKYMMIPYAQTTEMELFLVDRLVALLGTSVQINISPNDELLRRAGNESPWLIPDEVPFHELRELWATFHDKSYRLTKLYRLTPVCIPAARPMETEMTVDAQLPFLLPVAR